MCQIRIERGNRAKLIRQVTYIENTRIKRRRRLFRWYLDIGPTAKQISRDYHSRPRPGAKCRGNGSELEKTSPGAKN